MICCVVTGTGRRGLRLRVCADELSIDNIVNARSRRERVIYEGVRDLSPIASTESRDRLIGPIFIFLVKGSF
jgi:hypothetical protein